MVISAKYASICPACQERIDPGQRVEWARGSKARHASCPQAALDDDDRSYDAWLAAQGSSDFRIIEPLSDRDITPRSRWSRPNDEDPVEIWLRRKLGR